MRKSPENPSSLAFSTVALDAALSFSTYSCRNCTCPAAQHPLTGHCLLVADCNKTPQTPLQYMHFYLMYTAVEEPHVHVQQPSVQASSWPCGDTFEWSGVRTLRGTAPPPHRRARGLPWQPLRCKPGRTSCGPAWRSPSGPLQRYASRAALAAACGKSPDFHTCRPEPVAELLPQFSVPKHIG